MENRKISQINEEKQEDKTKQPSASDAYWDDSGDTELDEFIKGWVNKK